MRKAVRQISLLIIRLLAGATFSWADHRLDASGPKASSQDRVFAIRNGRLFEGTGAASIEEDVVLVEGDRVVAAGRAEEVSVPVYAATIDAAGRLIMPGIIDSHVHLTEPLAEGLDILTQWLHAGVTTLVDSGTIRDGIVVGDVVIDDGVAAFRDAVEQLADRPPRVMVGGPMLTAPGGYPATRPEDGACERHVVAALGG